MQSWGGCCEEPTHNMKYVLSEVFRRCTKTPQTNNGLGLSPFCTRQIHWGSPSRHPDCLLSSRATVPPHRPGSPLQRTKQSRMSFMKCCTRFSYNKDEVFFSKAFWSTLRNIVLPLSFLLGFKSFMSYTLTLSNYSTVGLQHTVESLLFSLTETCRCTMFA